LTPENAAVPGLEYQEVGVAQWLVRAGVLARNSALAARYLPWLASPSAIAATRYASDPSRFSTIRSVLNSDLSLRVSKTVADQLAGPRSYIPNQSILQTIGSGSRIADPQGVAGHFLYRSPAAYNRTAGTLEVLVDETNAVINHVLFRGGP
jgi:hypothetical protein